MQHISGISKMFKHFNDNSLNILVTIDLDQEITNEYVYNYIHIILQEYPFLKKKMIKHENEYILEDIESFNIDDHLTITETPFDPSSIINNEIDVFHFYWYIDKINHKNKYSIIIDHSYCDGYKLIEMLTKPLEKIELPKFNRNINLIKKIYHCIVGTIVLMIMNMKIIIRMIKDVFIKKEIKNNNTETDIILCKSFNLSSIKIFTK
jgi:hypothetical protein